MGRRRLPSWRTTDTVAPPSWAPLTSAPRRAWARPPRPRAVVTLLCLALVAAPLAVEGQAVARVPSVGILWIAPKPVVSPLHEAFRQGLRGLGYIEGETIVIEPRFADGKVERLAGLAEELVRLKVDVIVAPSTPAVRAAKQATTVVPIVMANVSDPVGFGFVASLSRPGGNVTGVANLTVELTAKNLELLKEAVPRLSRVAVLVNPSSPDAVAVWKAAEAGGRNLGLKLHLAEARSPGDLEKAIMEATNSMRMGSSSPRSRVCSSSTDGRSSRPPPGTGCPPCMPPRPMSWRRQAP